MVQLSYLYITNGKTVALTTWTFVSKVMSLLFNMLSRFVVASLPRSKRLLISWLQSPSAVILEPKKIKSVIVSIFFPLSICHDLCFLNVDFFFQKIMFECWFLSQFFHPPLSHSSRSSLVPLCFSAMHIGIIILKCKYYFNLNILERGGCTGKRKGPAKRFLRNPSDGSSSWWEVTSRKLVKKKQRKNTQNVEPWKSNEESTSQWRKWFVSQMLRLDQVRWGWELTIKFSN